MTINFEKSNGLVPAVIQDYRSNQVLMLGYMNEEALQQTLNTGKVTFYSRSKKRLWTKGETSGNFLYMREVLPDCDNDTLLIKAEPTGPVCHTGSNTCFMEDSAKGFLYRLEAIIADRKANPKENSYTTKLFDRGINYAAKKLGEEAVEMIIEACGNKLDQLKNEAADLIYHTIVLLAQKGVYSNLLAKDFS